METIPDLYAIQLIPLQTSTRFLVRFAHVSGSFGISGVFVLNYEPLDLKMELLLLFQRILPMINVNYSSKTMFTEPSRDQIDITCQANMHKLQSFKVF